jgi:hypothetical protein
MRALRLPPPDFNSRALPSIRLAAGQWCRVHPGSYNAIYFSKNIGHRFSHPQAPYGFLYLAKDVATCLWERFGDRLFDDQRKLPRSLWESMVISHVDIPPLKVCDLARISTRSELNVDLSSILHIDLSVPQLWGKAIQEHPDDVRGSRYLSRFTDRPCLVLFEKPGVVLNEKCLGPLTDLTAAAKFLDQHKVALY